MVVRHAISQAGERHRNVNNNNNAVVTRKGLVQINNFDEVNLRQREGTEGISPV